MNSLPLSTVLLTPKCIQDIRVSSGDAAAAAADDDDDGEEEDMFYHQFCHCCV